MNARTLVARAILGLALTCSSFGPACLAQETPLQQAQRLETEASADRQQAAAAHERARAAEELAQQARDEATKTTDPVIRSGWQRTVTEREEAAQHLKQQADELDQAIAKKTADAARLRAEAGTSPAPSGPLPAPSPSQPATTASSCNDSAADEPLPLDKTLGVWTSELDGSTIEISQKTPGDTTNVVLQSKHRWDGTYQGGKVKFALTPTVAQINVVAPPWARAAVAGKLEWTVELESKVKCGQPVLEGKWFPGEIKFREERDVDGTLLKQEASLLGPGTPIELKYMRQTPAIAEALSIDDQTRISTSGRPWWPYPYQPGAWFLDVRPRTLFVYGRGLPQSLREKIEIESADPNVGYRPIASSSQDDLTPMQKEQFAEGWREAKKNLDQPTQKLASGLQGMLIRVDLGAQVLPGMKQFRVNGLPASWRLRFGDDRAVISFARAAGFGREELTDMLFLPERFYVEVRTRAEIPALDEIPLRLQLEKSAITWNGSPTLVARRDAKQRTVYRTDLIEVREKGRPLPPADLGVYYLPAQPTDHVYAKLDDPFLLEGAPPRAKAEIFRAPSYVGMTWKDALTKAAKADGIDVTDWGQVPGATAATIANLSLSSIYGPGNVRLRLPLFVGNHAALLLLRDSFVQLMEEAQKSLPQIKDEATLRGLRESLKPYVWSDDTQWSHLKVTCPGGGECPFAFAVSDSYLEEKFGDKKQAADEWSLKAMAEAVGKFREAVQYAIRKAKPLDEDIEGLLRLVGFSYEPMLARTLPRMMVLKDVGKPPRQLWVPDLNARVQLMRIKSTALAVRDQQDYSKLDSQFALLEVAALAAPFMLGEGVLATAVVAGTDTSFFGVAMAGQVPDYVRQETDIHFALGASLILGTQHLSELELRRTEWYEVLANVGASAVGAALSTWRAVGAVRTSLILSKVEAGGLEAYKTLSIGDRDAFWRYVTEAKLLEEEGEAKAITQTHKRASEVADRVMEEMGVDAKAKTADVKPKIEATGEPGPREEERPIDIATDEREGTSGYGGKEEIAPAKKPLREREGEIIFEGLDSKGNPETFGPGVIVFQGKPRAFKFLAVGQYARVYELLDRSVAGCAAGCVLKIINGDGFWHAADVLANIRDGAALLGDEIPQLTNLHYSSPDAALPYLVQELLGPDMVHFDQFVMNKAGTKIVNPALVEFLSRPGVDEAIGELVGKFVRKNLSWEDFHPGNLYFFKDTDGKWVAGIFDQDRILDATKPREGKLGAWYGYMEAKHFPERVHSLYASEKNAFFGSPIEALDYFEKHPGPYYPDQEFFMEKTLECKGWIGWEPNSGHGGRPVKGLIDPAVLKKHLPRLYDPERAKTELPLIKGNEQANPALDDIFIDDNMPIDLNRPHWESGSLGRETVPDHVAAAVLANLAHRGQPMGALA